MSLIALAEQLRTGRPLARTLLLLIALTGALIVGLLAMHSLNTHAAAQTGRHAVTTVEASGASIDHSHVATASTAAAATNDAMTPSATNASCTDCATGHAGIFTLACVLALLAAVLLLAHLRGARRWLSLVPRPAPFATAPPGGNGLRPPSLTTLCISRT